MQPAHTLISTVGTSLFASNLDKLKAGEHEDLRQTYLSKNWLSTAQILRQQFKPSERLLGAEINSIAALEQRSWLDPQARLIFLVSDTPYGHNTLDVLRHYYQDREVSGQPIVDLQDQDPDRFAQAGLRNLVRSIGSVVRNFGYQGCMLNATGGYKAQVAIAAMLGQSLEIPVVYKHELFDRVIAFPPLPMSLDLDLWLRHSSLFFMLSSSQDLWSLDELDELKANLADERLGSLVDVELVEGQTLISLTPTGQIFHETFSHRFKGLRQKILPPPCNQKREPRLEDSGHMKAIRGLMEYLQALTREIPAIAQCRTTYSNPDLPRPSGFRLVGGELQGWYGDGKGLVKFAIDSTTQTEAQTQALASQCHQWLEQRR